MARQRIHNARAGQPSNSGASWISYSDMMAALVLVFVLILSISLHQYFTMLETKSAELDEKTLLITNQQLKLDEQTLQIANQKVTMDKQNAQIVVIMGQLDEQQEALNQATIILGQNQEKLNAAQAELSDAQAQLIIAQAALANKENELNAAQIILDSQQAALDYQAERIEAMVGVKSDIIVDLSSSLTRANLNATVDSTSGDIVLDSAVLFKTGSSDIQADGMALLNRFIPVYLEVLLRPEYSDYLGQIVIEGHTDDVGTYESNMKLSQERAYKVLMYVLNMYPEGSAKREKLQLLLTSTGRSESDLIYYPGTDVVDKDASRRVEFKFSLKDAEMIEEMNRLLSGD